MNVRRWAALALSGAALATGLALPAQHKADQVQVDTVRIPVPGRAPMDAYLVRPAHGRDLAGVLDLHWFEPGHASADNSEFLPEAIQLADRGVVSVLPQQRFPWDADPVGDARDRAAVLGGLADARAALTYLAEQRGVDGGRLGVVGHDYGAMYAAMLGQTDHRVRASVLVALDARWANWFDLFWLDLSGDAETAYFKLFQGLDPVDNVSRMGSRQFFQWSDDDFFIPAAIRDQFAAAAPAAPATTYPRTDHQMDLTVIESDRIAFLAGQLHF
jgi:hypothetical protein